MAEKSHLEKLRDVRDIQASKGTWNSSPYMHGMYHGLELALSILEGEREPEFRDRPEDGYLCDRQTELLPLSIMAQSMALFVYLWTGTYFYRKKGK